MIERHRNMREPFQYRAQARNLMEERHYTDRNTKGAGAFPDRKSSRVVEPRPFAFRGSKQAQAPHAALPYPVAQIVRRVVL